MKNVEIEITKINCPNSNCCDDYYEITDNLTLTTYVAVRYLLLNIGFTEEESNVIKALWRNEEEISKHIVKFASIALEKRKLGTLSAINIEVLPQAFKLIENSNGSLNKKAIKKLRLFELYYNSTNEKEVPELGISIVSCKTVACKLEESEYKSKKTPIVKNDSLIEKKIEENFEESPEKDWGYSMHCKYKLIEKHFNITRSELYHNILQEMKDLYKLNYRKLKKDYCQKYNVSNCYSLDAITDIPDLKCKLENMVNKILIEEKIVSENLLKDRKYITLFSNILYLEDI